MMKWLCGFSVLSVLFISTANAGGGLSPAYPPLDKRIFESYIIYHFPDFVRVLAEGEPIRLLTVIDEMPHYSGKNGIRAPMAMFNIQTQVKNGHITMAIDNFLDMRLMDQFMEEFYAALVKLNLSELIPPVTTQSAASLSAGEK